VAAQTIFPGSELILVHNEPTQDELAIAARFGEQYPTQMQHLTVSPVEPLGASWNRGWQEARGEYLCVWNVDDRRPPDSLEVQVRLLDQNPQHVMAYGDYITAPAYGLETGWLRKTPRRFDKALFSREFPQGGAFLMWRRSLAEQIGYFDEQFKGGADFDFSVRVALNDLTMARAEGLMGYFTDAQQGLSTRDGASLGSIERTVIQLRYGAFDLVRWEYLGPAKKYRLGQAYYRGQWHPLSDLVPGYAAFIRRRRPLWVLGTLRNSTRWLMARLGLLDAIHRLQRRSTYREVK
jgi:hypothetical protein